MPKAIRARQRALRPARKVTVVALLCSLLGLSVLLGAAPAQAAPPYDVEGTVTSVESDWDRVQTGEYFEINGTWTLPDNPEGKAGLEIQLPEGLGLINSNLDFPLLSPEGNEMGHCVPASRQLVNCDLDSAYLEDHPLDIHGTFTMKVQMMTEVEEEREVTYDVSEASFSIRVYTPNNPEKCTENCDFPGEGEAKGGELRDDGSIVWTVKLPTPAEGQPAGRITVTDDLGPNQIITDVEVVAVDHVTLHPRYEYYTLRDMAPLDRSEYTVSADLRTVEFQAKKGWYYRVLFHTQVTDGRASEFYDNAVSIDMVNQGVRLDRVEGRAENQAGSGTGEGTSSPTPTEPTPTEPTPTEPTPTEPTPTEPTPTEPTPTEPTPTEPTPTEPTPSEPTPSEPTPSEPTATPSEPGPETTTPGQTNEQGEVAGASAVAAPEDSDNGDGGLAATGAGPMGPLIGGAALMLLTGIALVFRAGRSAKR